MTPPNQSTNKPRIKAAKYAARISSKTDEEIRSLVQKLEAQRKECV